jgi:hypothetical protein
MKYLLPYWFHRELYFYPSDEQLESLEIIEDYYIGEDLEEFAVYETIYFVGCIEVKEDVVPVIGKMVNHFAENLGLNVINNHNLWVNT